MTAPKDEITKCIKDNGLCGVGGFCDVCPHVMNNQDKISVEAIIKEFQDRLKAFSLHALATDNELIKRNKPIYESTITHLRRLQQMEADIAAKDKILDQHIAALTPPILGIFR